MEMIPCPHCGAQNSSKREFCFQCEGELRGQTQKQEHDYVPTCSTCLHAVIYPPAGIRLSPDQVWCTQREEAMSSSRVASNCFVEAFGWKRSEILD